MTISRPHQAWGHMKRTRQEVVNPAFLLVLWPPTRVDMSCDVFGSEKGPGLGGLWQLLAIALPRESDFAKYRTCSPPNVR